MQIAKIIPKVSTRGEGVFDYAIPPEILPDIKIGVLVLVPFRGRKVEGIIIDISRSSKIQVLSSIISLIDPVPVVDEAHIKLAKWMSQYYLAPFSKTLFENIVPPAKRTINKQNLPSNTSVPPKILDKQKNNKKYLVVSDFQTRLKFYLKAIEKTLTRHQQIIILVPDLSLVPFFTRSIKNKISIIHAGLTKTRRWLEWDKIRRGEIDIVIGSNSALFAPVPNLGLIIIDQEENETYKNFQTPKFHTVRVAEELTRLTAARLVLGSITPRVETYFEAVREKYLFLKFPKIPDISLVDMNSERQVLSLPLQKSIEETLSKNQKIILVLNRKGEGSTFRCSDCNWVYRCPQCQLPLIPVNQSGSKTICYNCEKEFAIIEQCPNCQSFKLRPFGLTTAKLEKFVRDFWPKAKIIRIEKDGKTDYRQNWDIAITTNFALKFNYSNIGLVGIVDADQGLNFPGFRTAEKNFETLFKFLRLGKQGIIQTRMSENPIFSNLASLNYEKFFLEEIANRQKFNYPPFTRLIRLLYRNTSEETAICEASQVYKKIKDLIPHPLSSTAILGPSPAFLAKKRDYFYYQIILKLKKRDSNIDRLLLTLPKGWTIDVDPFDLL